ncbi:MAG TPA: hypothetical protein VKU00_22285 [Chthonomonadaceae bacterium]|nr:hypothetical protein [Chthonomonadaceae bacterium]
MHKRLLLLGGLLALIVGLSPNAGADGAINLRTLLDFQSALSGTNPLFTGLNPSVTSDPNTIATSKEYSDFSFSGASSTLETQSKYNFVPSVSVANNTVGICAALYRYPTDPDLSSYNLSFQLYVPQVSSGPNSSGIDTFSFALIDSLNRVEFWQFNDNTLNAGNNQINIDFATTTPTFADTKFEITHVNYVQFSFHGTLTDSFPANPDPNQSGTLWIGNQTLQSSTPEPGPTVAFAIGALCVAAQCALRLRRRKRPQ